MEEVDHSSRDVLQLFAVCGQDSHAMLRDTARWDALVLERGLSVRSIFLRKAARSALSCLERLSDLGAEIRLCSESWGHMVIFDRSVVIVVTHPTASASPDPWLQATPPRKPPDLGHHQASSDAVVIKETALVDCLVGTFEAAWRSATQFIPASLAATAAPGTTTALERTAQIAPQSTAHESTVPAPASFKPTEQAIIELMAAGLKDEVIARKLGISVRTCRSHIARLISHLGAQSRFQAGVYAASSGVCCMSARTAEASTAIGGISRPLRRQ
jgi:DNA-binding CsgD family transcriptional regulator